MQNPFFFGHLKFGNFLSQKNALNSVLIQEEKQHMEVILASFSFTLKCFSVFYIVTLLIWEFTRI